MARQRQGPQKRIPESNAAPLAMIDWERCGASIVSMLFGPFAIALRDGRRLCRYFVGLLRHTSKYAR